MYAVQLGDVPVGEIGVWKNKVVGEVFFEVKEHFENHTLVVADNNVSYEWRNSMEVWLDDKVVLP